MNVIPDGNSYLQLLNELYRAFNFFNTYFSEGSLICPVLTISPLESESVDSIAFAWHGMNIWKRNGRDLGEINICAEYLCRPPEEILESLLHEMAHLKNAQNGIIDCNTRTQYHYKAFKTSALSFGLDVSRNNKGYSITSLGSRASSALEALQINRELFGMYRTFREEIPRLAAKRSRQYITLHVKNNEKMVDALSILTKSKKSRIKAVENALYAAAQQVNFNDII